MLEQGKTMQHTQAASTEGAILSRVIRPERVGPLTPDLARAILDLDFEEEDKKRMHELAEKAREGSLTDADKEAIANYERVGSFLSLLQVKARRALKNGSK
jgi:hypothetical protein